ncbi:MAG TPA: hypothetical protein VF751_00100 [Chthoniobacterales bacterium]
MREHPAALEFIRRCAVLGETAAPIEQGRLIRIPVVVLAGAYLSLLVATLATSIGLLRADFRKTVGPLVILTLLVFGYNAAAALEIAILHVFDGPRYSTIQFCFTVFAEFLALRLLLEVLGHLIRWGRPIQTSTPGE